MLMGRHPSHDLPLRSWISIGCGHPQQALLPGRLPAARARCGQEELLGALHPHPPAGLFTGDFWDGRSFPRDCEVDDSLVGNMHSVYPGVLQCCALAAAPAVCVGWMECKIFSFLVSCLSRNLLRLSQIASFSIISMLFCLFDRNTRICPCSSRIRCLMAFSGVACKRLRLCLFLVFWSAVDGPAFRHLAEFW